MRIYLFLISIIFISSCAVGEVPMETLDTRECLNPHTDEEVKVIYEKAGRRLPEWAADEQNENPEYFDEKSMSPYEIFKQKLLDRELWDKELCPDGSNEWIYETDANLPVTGIGVGYDDNGFLQSKWRYKNGLKHGMSKFYQEGTLTGRKCYQNGEQVSILYCE